MKINRIIRRIRKHNMLYGLSILFVCSLLLGACSPIADQTISRSGSGNMGGGMMGGGQNMSRGPGSMHQTADADVVGQVVSVNGSTLKVKLTEQSNNKNNNKTSEEKTFTIDKSVQISEGPGMMPQTDRTNSQKDADSAAVSKMRSTDLTPGAMIMIWYKDHTENIERIAVIS